MKAKPPYRAAVSEGTRSFQVEHMIRLIKPILEGKVRSVAAREDASAKYNSWLQARLARCVGNFGDSYYRREGTDGKITVTFPGPVSLFWWLARRSRYSDYDIAGGEEWNVGLNLRGWSGLGSSC